MTELEKVKAERDALVAKLAEWDRLHSDATNAEYVVDEEGSVIGRYVDYEWLERGDEISGREPTTSLARRDLLKQAEALEELGPGLVDIIDRSQAKRMAQELRRQAEEK